MKQFRIHTAFDGLPNVNMLPGGAWAARGTRITQSSEQARRQDTDLTGLLFATHGSVII